MKVSEKTTRIISIAIVIGVITFLLGGHLSQAMYASKIVHGLMAYAFVLLAIAIGYLLFKKK